MDEKNKLGLIKREKKKGKESLGRRAVQALRIIRWKTGQVQPLSESYDLNLLWEKLKVSLFKWTRRTGQLLTLLTAFSLAPYSAKIPAAALLVILAPVVGRDLWWQRRGIIPKKPC